MHILSKQGTHYSLLIFESFFTRRLDGSEISTVLVFDPRKAKLNKKNFFLYVFSFNTQIHNKYTENKRLEHKFYYLVTPYHP